MYQPLYDFEGVTKLQEQKIKPIPIIETLETTHKKRTHRKIIVQDSESEESE